MRDHSRCPRTFRSYRGIFLCFDRSARMARWMPSSNPADEPRWWHAAGAGPARWGDRLRIYRRFPGADPAGRGLPLAGRNCNRALIQACGIGLRPISHHLAARRHYLIVIACTRHCLTGLTGRNSRRFSITRLRYDAQPLAGRREPKLPLALGICGIRAAPPKIIRVRNRVQECTRRFHTVEVSPSEPV
jgi:hypothetical protein